MTQNSLEEAIINYELTISEQNTQAHLDIERDIAKQKDGLFTFTIRLNNGNILDYTITEYADARKYLKLTEVIIEELTIAHDLSLGDQTNPIRTDNT